MSKELEGLGIPVTIDGRDEETPLDSRALLELGYGKTSVARELAIQEAVYTGIMYAGMTVDVPRLVFLTAAKRFVELSRGQHQKIPLELFQVILAQLEYPEMGEILDSRKFTHVWEFRPSMNELQAHEISIDYLHEVTDGPAVYAGSAISVYWDGIDENRVCLSPVHEGYYAGRWSLAGGHGKSLVDMVAQRELEEETGRDDLASWLRPLGVADQVVFVEESGEVGLRRYLNLIWSLNLPIEVKTFINKEQFKWAWIDDDIVDMMRRQGKLTPIAEAAVDMVGV